VKNGTISGVHSSTYNEDYFLGIPYAQPPVNGLRFQGSSVSEHNLEQHIRRN
jgi:carboxylesterase type B